ncbi:MAG: hypothetical protein R2749_17660 [Acidimicrobiales bacterium]
MDAFAATGVVDDEVLDLLAQAFVQADEHVWWRCPDDWFDGELVIELGDDAAAGKSSAAEEPAGGGPTVVRRRVPPAVRRWAVRRLVAQQPSRWGPVLQLATAAPTKVAAPILLGLLDGEASLTAAAADLVREAAIASSDATVRMAGLRHLAASDRDAAVARAAARSRIGRCRTGWFDHALGLHPSEPSEHGGPGELESLGQFARRHWSSGQQGADLSTAVSPRGAVAGGSDGSWWRTPPIDPHHSRVPHRPPAIPGLVDEPSCGQTAELARGGERVRSVERSVLLVVHSAVAMEKGQGESLAVVQGRRVDPGQVVQGIGIEQTVVVQHDAELPDVVSNARRFDAGVSKGSGKGEQAGASVLAHGATRRAEFDILQQLGEPCVARRGDRFGEKVLLGDGSVEPTGARHLESVGVQLDAQLGAPRQCVVVPVHQRVGDQLAYRFLRILPLVVTAEPDDDGAPFHVAPHGGEGLGHHEWDRPVDRLVVEEPRAVGQRLAVGCGEGDEGDIELGEELLWIATERQQPGEAHRIFTAVVGHRDPEHAEDLVVGCIGEDRAAGGTEASDEVREQGGVEVCHRGAGHRRAVIDGLPARRAQHRYFIGGEGSVPVVRAQERTPLDAPRSNETRPQLDRQRIDGTDHDRMAVQVKRCPRRLGWEGPTGRRMRTSGRQRAWQRRRAPVGRRRPRPSPGSVGRRLRW